MKLITRGDDAGSSRSANSAIYKVIQFGLVKNVSIMAPGPFVEEFAEMACQLNNITFGMHITLNAEWDKVKWKPLTGNPTGLVDASGYFLSHPKLFEDTKPSLDTIMEEVDAQYLKLLNLGFKIKYMDTHMFPETIVEGLQKRLVRYAEEKKLIFQTNYTNWIEWDQLLHKNKFDQSQGIIIFHPSLDTDEMRLTGNQEYSGDLIASQRAYETSLLTSQKTIQLFTNKQINPISYCEATLSLLQSNETEGDK